MIVTSATSQNWKKNTLAQNLKVFILKVKFHHCGFLLVENGNKKSVFFGFLVTKSQNFYLTISQF
jgi:hypothetical protein